MDDLINPDFSARLAKVEERSRSLRDTMVETKEIVEAIRREQHEQSRKLDQQAAQRASVETDVERRLVAVESARRDGDRVLHERADALAEKLAALGAHGPVWSTPEGRQVVWWVLAAQVACALAIGGGLTYADIRAYLPAVQSPAPAVEVRTTPPHTPAPPTPDHPRPGE
jgi:hypothetical protein